MSIYMNGYDDDVHISKLDQTLWGGHGAYRDTDIAQPSTAMVFIDEPAKDNVNGAFFYRVAPGQNWNSAVSDRDAQSGANLGFADGHVAHWRWRWPKSYTDGVVANQFDLADLRRLQETIP